MTEANAHDAKATASRSDIARFRANLKDELEAAGLYETMAVAEKDEERASIFKELGEVERAHAQVWIKKLEAAGETVGPPKSSMRTRMLSLLARRFGPGSIVPILQGIEKNADGGYARQPDAKALGMDRQEKVHTKVFENMDGGGASILVGESWHRRDSGGSLRAAVFGINDGLVSNFSLIMGVAGASQDTKSILIAGVAGMLAGAFSMGSGEYVSVRSQKELFEHEIRKEEEELRDSPEEEMKELALIYRAKGIPKEAADQLAASIISNPGSAIDTLAREELGLDPGDLGSPWRVAFSSFAAFVAGAIIPLLPFFFLKGTTGVLVSAVMSGAALFAIGATLSLFTGRSWFLSGLRMLAIGGLVALVTNMLGRLLGVTLN
jgi:VIT1/CCC1 family predicted Fe2+/Mn2+ transporter